MIFVENKRVHGRIVKVKHRDWYVPMTIFPFYKTYLLPIIIDFPVIPTLLLFFTKDVTIRPLSTIKPDANNAKTRF